MAAIIQTIDGVVTNKFYIDKAVLKFGRTSSNQIQIDDLAVSNEHAQIISKKGSKGETLYFLEDLNSTNGSFINDTQIGKQRLHHKDSLRIGWNMFTFIDEDAVNLEKTSEIKKSWIPGIYYSK